MNLIKKFIILFSFTYVYFIGLSASEDKLHQYSVIELPDGFDVTPHYSYTRTLNIHGQVAGVVDGKAAFWDKYRGLSVIPIEGKTDPRALNDNGFICVQQQQLGNNVLVWDMSTDEIINGPIGIPLTINNLNDVLIYNGYSRDIWNPTTGLVSSLIASIYSINNKGTQLAEHLGNNIYSISINDNDNILARRNQDVFFYTKGEYYLVSLSKVRNGFGFLNNMDEIVTLVYMDNSQKKQAITKWKKGQKVTYSENLEDLEELKGCSIIGIKGVNDKGQIVLSTVKNNGQTKKCFLLTPKK